MTTEQREIQPKPVTSRSHFVMCVCGAHALCPGVVEKEDHLRECSCECHTDPDFVFRCNRCMSAVDYRKTERGSLVPFNLDGSRHPFFFDCGSTS